MGNFKANEKEILNALVSDCINYGFSEKDALSYIKARLGGREISAETYYRRKKIVDPGSYASEWISYFSRVGFVVKHKQIIDIIEMIQRDILRDYLFEQNRNTDDRNQPLIRQLRFDIRENSKLLQELTLGTPIIAQIKVRIDKLEEENKLLLTK